MMKVYEPLFLLLALATAITLVTAIVLALAGRFRRAGRILLRLGIAAAVYMTIVIVVTLFVTPRIYRVGDEQCREDWCITVTSWRRPVDASTDTLEISLRLSSRARRVAMGERGTVIYLVDGDQRRFDPLPNPTELPFSFVLQPGQAVETTRRFRVPTDARNLGVIYTNEGGLPINWFIITEGGWFMKKPIVELR